jgi:hypothetical protein
LEVEAAKELDHRQEIRRPMTLVQYFERTFIEGFDGGGYEEAAGRLENPEQRSVPYEVLYLDGNVVGEAGPIARHRLDDPYRVSGTVEEVRIPEGDVPGARADLSADVFEHDFGLNHETVRCRRNVGQ